MTDAISRSALLDFARNHVGGTVDVNDIARFPALDVAPVVHARWIYTGEMDEDDNCEANCSHCGAGDKHRADLKDAVPYCWECGARMDGDAE